MHYNNKKIQNYNEIYNHLNICRDKKMYLYICIEIKYTLKNDNCKVFQTTFVPFFTYFSDSFIDFNSNIEL